ncbi:hypothetical protein [Flavobacterium daemonense]|uniref:hypothetical protein n=1 Tax=Flavobacterium daemonense TaxID=1393049 RepID=UPI001186D5B9|nr:hypothetical protein [Flavobacterium daemonense]KAF2333716.1 hypothetical protein FND99_09590 [Flavobacterium daemonense]
MKKNLLLFLVVMTSVMYQPIFSQTEDTEPPLGLPGDNLDLYAVLSLFQKSKTIEEFEKKLNLKETGINNLDLNLDKKADFIKVVTKKDGNSFTFILQVNVSKSETQDVAIILVSKDKNGKVSLQMVGDEDLYGKNYVIEPKKDVPAVTANPAYKGENPVTTSTPATTVIVEQAPIVQYVYSPAYVPYYPPYYYGYYPPYFAAFTVLAVGIYRHNHWYHGGHYGYHGGHYGGHNNIVINNNNRNSINHYNSNRSRSNTVARNNQGGRYGNSVSNRATNTGVSNRASNNGVSNRASNGAGNRGSGVSDRSSVNRPSTGTSNRPSAGTSDRSSSFDRPSAGTSNRSSSNFNSGGGRTRSGGGGGFSGGGGGFSGGGGRRR